MPRGRPRKTDPDVVLDLAMKAFWERGFDGTSMNDLAEKTGMAKPGLYANFGDKEAIYAKAMERYCSIYAGPMLEDLVRSTDSLEATVRRFLDGVVAVATETMGPKGCFVANNLVECAGKLILIDCGMYQGGRELVEENAEPLGFDAADIDFLLLTHAHLDHCGRIPLLARRGFSGEIITTSASVELALVAR